MKVEYVHNVVLVNFENGCDAYAYISVLISIGMTLLKLPFLHLEINS